MTHRRDVLGPFRDDGRGTSDVIGSALLVGIVVITMTGLAIAVLNTPGPSERVHAQVDVEAHPGADGTWGTADEEIRLDHVGGDRLPQEGTRIGLVIDGNGENLKRGALGGAFSDGALSIGETHTLTRTIQSDSKVTVDIVVRDEAETLVAANDIDVAAITGGNP